MILTSATPHTSPTPSSLLLPPAISIDNAARQARQQFAHLEAWLASPDTLRLPLHQIESQQEHQGRELQRLLLQTHIHQRGNGDVGSALLVIQDGKQALYSHRRLHSRLLKSIFGPLRITRMSYSRPGAASIHPLDEALQLPARSFSYELQKRMVKAAVQGTFHETRERIAEITGAPVFARSIEEVIRDAATDFDAFYAQRTPVAWTDTASILVAAVDGKGIPMVKPGGAARVVRRTKGQKPNRKKMATVATVFTRAPWIRTPQQVVESLFCNRTSTAWSFNGTYRLEKNSRPAPLSSWRPNCSRQRNSSNKKKLRWAALNPATSWISPSPSSSIWKLLRP